MYGLWVTKKIFFKFVEKLKLSKNIGVHKLRFFRFLLGVGILCTNNVSNTNTISSELQFGEPKLNCQCFN